MIRKSFSGNLRSAALLICVVGLSVSCGGGNSERARALLARADSAFLAKDYLLSDSLSKAVDALSPTDTLLRREALILHRRARLAYCNDRLDSISASAEMQTPRLDSLRRTFRVVQVEAVDPVSLVRPGIVAQGSRSGLQFSTDTLGRMNLMSVYAGPRPLKHASVRLTNTLTGASFTAAAVPYDDGMNYRYTAAGMQYEKVTYTAADAMRAGLLLQNAAEGKAAVEVVYLSAGLKPAGYRITLSPSSLPDYAATVRLATMLRQSAAGRQMRINFDKERRYLRAVLPAKYTEEPPASAK